ncbi:MAG: hypothetical protein ACYDAC_04935 [Candidatus Dormibacteria bacterium]
MSRGFLLGPVAADDAVRQVLSGLGIEAPIAVVSAGWEAAERNDSALNRAFGGGTRNLGLYGRRLDVLARDTEYAAAHNSLRNELSDLQEVYRVQLRHALLGIEAVRAHTTRARRRTAPELDDAVQSVRALDDHHAARIAALYADFYAAHPPHERPVIAEHRHEVAAILEDCSAVAIAGGHIGVLNDALHLSNLGAALGDRPVIAWSSGAMAVAERVMVADDHDLAGRPDEVLAEGIGIVKGTVPLPDARRRLRIDDRDHLSLLAHRVAPRVAVLLDEGDVLPFGDDGVPDFQLARVLAPDGTVIATAEAA